MLFDRMARPRIGITTDVAEDRYRVGRAYADLVAQNGGCALLLPAHPEAACDYLEICQAFILTGGDDPRMEQWGVRTHPKATPMDARRQAFEVTLLERLEEQPEVPVLGICLGMQLMALQSGGELDQHLPDRLSTAAMHWGKVEHDVEGALGRGRVHSHHRQAVTDPGSLEVVAVAPDGVVEAVRARDRRYYLGVQWHAERTGDARLGIDLIRQLIAAAS